MSENKPIVSVIIPVFRVEKYLRTSVKCITDQTYRDLQIIIVDDGSDDGCPQICDELAAEDSRITVIHKENGGLSSARNAGLEKAEGKYIYFFDSDDLVDVHAIEKAVEVYEKNDVDLVSFSFRKVKENGELYSNPGLVPGRYDFKTQKEKLYFIYKVLCHYVISWEVWNRLYRADIIKKYNIRFENNKEIFAEDRCFNIYYTLCSDNVICMEDRFYDYLLRDNSIMGKAKRAKINENLKLMDHIRNFAKTNGLNVVYKKWQFINIALFCPVMSRITKDEYHEYRQSWNCTDINERFGNPFTRYYYFAKVWGPRGGLEKMKEFNEFIKA